MLPWIFKTTYKTISFVFIRKIDVPVAIFLLVEIIMLINIGIINIGGLLEKGEWRGNAAVPKYNRMGCRCRTRFGWLLGVWWPRDDDRNRCSSPHDIRRAWSSLLRHNMEGTSLTGHQCGNSFIKVWFLVNKLNIYNKIKQL